MCEADMCDSMIVSLYTRTPYYMNKTDVLYKYCHIEPDQNNKHDVLPFTIDRHRNNATATHHCYMVYVDPQYYNTTLQNLLFLVII